MKRWIFWSVILLVLAGASTGVYLWRSHAAADPVSDSLTEVVPVQRGDLTASISPTGQVYSPHTAQLSFDVVKIPLTELDVSAGQEVKQGGVLARIDPSSLQRAVEQAKADLASAQDALTQAQTPSTQADQDKAALAVTQAQTALEQAKQKLSDLQSPDLVSARRAVRQAQFQLDSAALNLAIAQSGNVVGKTVRDLQYSVDWHERHLRDLQAQRQHGQVDQDTVDTEAHALADAQAQLAAAQGKAASTLTGAEQAVTDAEATLADARSSLADLQAGPTALDQAQAQDAVAQAEYNLARAQDDLANVQAGADSKEVQLAQARYDAAQATLDEAQATLDAATMVAPFDGTVISTGAEVGDEVSSGTVVVTLADLSELRVMASIDETDISNVQVGQDVLITFDAFPGKQFQGKVLEVPLEGTLSQNIVTYQVPISLAVEDRTAGVAIKSGMTANLKIVVGQRQNALLIPALAVEQGDNGDVVMVEDAVSGQTVQTPVEVGLSDGQYVEVVRGLNEGDQVVVRLQSSSQQNNGFGRFRNVGGGIRVIGGGSIP